MKKILAMTLAVILALSMAACGSAGSDIIQDIATDLQNKLLRGAVVGNVYSSEYSGLTFTAPEGWIYATDEQIAQTMQIGQEDLSDDVAYNEAVANLASVYDAMVTGPDGSNINFLFENLQVTNALSYSEEDYLNAVKSQLSMLTELTYEISDEITTVQLCGQDYSVMSAVTSYNGVNMVQNYYVRRVGNYICAVVMTCVGDTAPESLEACFG